VSRPTAMEQARHRADLIKAVSTYAQIGTVVDALDGVISAEAARFGVDSVVAEQLIAASKVLVCARDEADRRCRE
jgi:hypothetical protein